MALLPYYVTGRRLVESVYEAEGGVVDCVEPSGWYLAVRGLIVEDVWPVYYVGGGAGAGDRRA
ncbi:MAG: hypothetical protein QXK62_06430 [Thermoproteus sp.]